MNTAPSPLRDRVLQAAAARKSPTRRTHRQKRALVLGIPLLGLVAFAVMPPLSLRGRPLSYVLVSVGVMLVVAAASASWVLARGTSTLGRPRDSLRKVIAAVPWGLALGALAANVAAPDTWIAPTSDLLIHCECALVSLGIGAALLVSFAWTERESDPIAPRVTGASFGAAAGALSALVLAIRCPHADPVHVLVTHVIPVALLAALGAVVGARWLALKGARSVSSSTSTR